MSHELERSVLGGMLLLDKEPLPPQARNLEPEHFTSMVHAQIFNAIMEVTEKGDPVDLVTVHQVLKSWELDYFEEIARMAWDMPTAANLGHYSKLLGDQGRIKSMQKKIEVAMERSQGKTLDDVRAGVSDALNSLGDDVVAGGFHPIQNVVRDVLNDLIDESQSAGGGALVTTGLHAIDKVMMMRAGELTILAARPGMGKTALVCGICHHAASSGVPVAFYTLEMTDADLTKRMLAHATQTPMNELANAAQVGRLTTPMNELYKLPIFINDKPARSAHDIRREINAAPEIKLVIVDYLQLMKFDKAERHDLRVGQATKALKAIAKEFDCHVIALSQLNRGVETRGGDKRPRISDLRDSGNIEEDADNVILLWRNGYYDETDHSGEAEIDIAKHRRGRTVKIFVRWKPETQSFEDW